MEQRKTAGRGMAVLLSAALAPAVGMPAIALADDTGAGQAADAVVSAGSAQKSPQTGAGLEPVSVPEDSLSASGAGSALVAEEAFGYVVDGAGNIQISSAEGLRHLAEVVNGGDSLQGKVVSLVADIDLANEEWTPIGKSGASFSGAFDGGSHIISNLLISAPVSTADSSANKGLFGCVSNAEIKNLTLHNVHITGGMGVGAIVGAMTGDPFASSSKMTNLTLMGGVQVSGHSYVGGMVGKDASSALSDLAVEAKEGSRVEANSGSSMTYVGGVIGFMAPGAHSVSDVVSNIDVYGSTSGVGGIASNVHGNNTFKNCVVADGVQVSCTAADPAFHPHNTLKIGGVVGLWANATGDCTVEECSFGGTLSSTSADGEDFTSLVQENGVVGGMWAQMPPGGAYSLRIVENGVTTIVPGGVRAFDNVLQNLEDGDIVRLPGDIECDIVVPEGVSATIDLAGHSLTNEAGHTIVNNGTLVIKDSRGNGSIGNVAEGKGTIVNTGTLTIEGGRVDGDIYKAEYVNGELQKVEDDSDASVISIEGGVFEKEPSSHFVAPGYSLVQNADGTFGVVEAKVAEVDGVVYPTLDEAIFAAQGGATVKLLDDVSSSSAFRIDGKDLTIDLNGYTVEVLDPVDIVGFMIENGTLTFDDTSAEGDGVLKVGGNGAGVGVLLGSGGGFDMDGGAIDAGEIGVMTRSEGCAIAVDGGYIKGGLVGIRAYDEATVVMSDGVVEGEDLGILTSPLPNQGGVRISVSGGEVKGTGEDGMGMYLPGSDGETVITGGTITGATGIDFRAGSLEVSDEAVISGTGAPVDYDPARGAGIAVVQYSDGQPVKVAVDDGAQVSGYQAFYEFNPYGYPAESFDAVEIAVEGGMLTATGADVESAVYSESLTGFVSGGTFSMPVDAKYIAPGYGLIDNGDGTYGIAKAELNFSNAVKNGVFEYDVLGGKAPELTEDDMIALAEVNVEGYEVSFEGDLDALNEAVRNADTSERFPFEFNAEKVGVDGDVLASILADVKLVDSAEQGGDQGGDSGDSQGGDQGGSGGGDSLEELKQQLQDAIGKAVDEMNRIQGQALDELKKALSDAEKAIESGDRAAIQEALDRLNAALGQPGPNGASGKPGTLGQIGTPGGSFATTADPAATAAAAVAAVGAAAAATGFIAMRRGRKGA